MSGKGGKIKETGNELDELDLSISGSVFQIPCMKASLITGLIFGTTVNFGLLLKRWRGVYKVAKEYQHVIKPHGNPPMMYAMIFGCGSAICCWGICRYFRMQHELVVKGLLVSQRDITAQAPLMNNPSQAGPITNKNKNKEGEV